MMDFSATDREVVYSIPASAPLIAELSIVDVQLRL